MCIQKPHLRDPMPAENAKTLKMVQQNTSDKQNAQYVTDLESIVEPYKTSPCTDAVLKHFNQKGHKLTDTELIPLEFINSKRESTRRAHESF